MKVALISDLHSSIIPLDAVLADCARSGADRIVCLGDVVDLGPRPREVIARLRERNIPCLLGNHDVLDEPPLPPEEVNAWCKSLLTESDRAFLRSLPRSLELELPSGGRLVCVHGSPLSFDDQLLADTPAATLDEWIAPFADRTPAIIAAGHTHIQMLRRRGRTTWMNAGSVAEPFLEPFDPENPRPPKIMPWAEYAIVTDDGGGPDIELRRVRYDFAAYVRDVWSSGLPDPKRWLSTWQKDQ